MVERKREAGAEVEVTEEMREKGKRALLKLVAEDDLRNDPAWVAESVYRAMAHQCGMGICAPVRPKAAKIRGRA
jgi:hypothetical protein